MTKYRQYFQKMLSDNQEIFASFRLLHDNYALDQEKWQEEFNLKGEKILEIVREYENRLCANTERGMYNKFSANLAEKFQNEVRKHFPMIDYIGVKTKPNNLSSTDIFAIKRIKLN
ncbi:hypothetical protein A2Z22_04165 [Candidatus Woesebacteria bacterium RBG_16_34_12]|uniref:Uncharacterized protein n=1 Tax=Candidatus Woesebacteria bacterium RBG_16_34_12 TaxID=1802480 RepID=A0A1F7X7I2_9BACT|nr:MAG: hypothetical protein A2Z22_04165 [Candidatus Woesebacteria bacterium RBG_16_34_12]